MQKDIFIRGSGRASLAAQVALGVLKNIEPSLEIGPIEVLKRETRLEQVIKNPETSVLIIANPPGLHCSAIIEAAQLNLGLIVCEKPVCVAKTEIEALRKIKSKVGVLHGYRQTWGVQTLQKMIKRGEVGQVFAIEGRYWQSSAARRAVAGQDPNLKLSDQSAPHASNWKNDVKLGGPFDALLDIASHWSDAAIFLSQQKPLSAQAWLSYANTEASHRDTHVQLSIELTKNMRALGSISKTFHGATNHFELNVIGTDKALTWNFLNPDQIVIGQGSKTEIHARHENTFGSHFAAFHAMGWVEGYVEIIRQGLKHMNNQDFMPYPTLQEGLDNIELLIDAASKA